MKRHEPGDRVRMRRSGAHGTVLRRAVSFDGVQVQWDEGSKPLDRPQLVSDGELEAIAQ